MQALGVSAAAVKIGGAIAVLTAQNPTWSRADLIRPAGLIAREHTPDYVEIRTGSDPNSAHGIVISMTMPMTAEGLIIDSRDGSFVHLRV